MLKGPMKKWVVGAAIVVAVILLIVFVLPMLKPQGMAGPTSILQSAMGKQGMVPWRRATYRPAPLAPTAGT